MWGGWSRGVWAWGGWSRGGVQGKSRVAFSMLLSAGISYPRVAHFCRCEAELWRSSPSTCQSPEGCRAADQTNCHLAKRPQSQPGRNETDSPESVRTVIPNRAPILTALLCINIGSLFALIWNGNCLVVTLREDRFHNRC